MENTHSLQNPEMLFEVSWEVCNKVGGIYTVLSTKYKALANQIGRENIILIGPDVWKETTAHPDFEEDPQLLKSWREQAANQNLFFRVGRWKIPERPMAVLVDHSSFFPVKDEIFTKFWEDYRLDSLSGQWDYIEPAIFGYAAGRVIESYYRHHHTNRDSLLAHFHEWMTGTGVLYLKKNTPGIATAFTTHATVVGRAMAGNGLDLYKNLPTVNTDMIAGRFQVRSKHSLEKLAAVNADLFTTVSGITALECKHLLGIEPHVITTNGFNPDWVPDKTEQMSIRQNARKKILQIAEAMFNTNFDQDTFMVLTSGRYEFRNKGLDLFIEAAGMIRKEQNNTRKTLAVIAVPGYHHGLRPDLLQKIKQKEIPLNGTHHALTHMLHHPESDPVIQNIDRVELKNKPGDSVHIMFIPTYLDGHDGLLDIPYYQFLAAFDLTVFPSYYEPWGYTPLESIAFGIPTITTSLAGFGVWVDQTEKYSGDAVKVIHRDDHNAVEASRKLKDEIMHFQRLKDENLKIGSEEARNLAQKANWDFFLINYLDGYQLALKKSSLRAADDPYFINRAPKPPVTITKEKPQWLKVLVKASYPDELKKLRKLADNLWWCWNPDATKLFMSVNPDLWGKSGNNPIKLLGMLNSDQLNDLAADQTFASQLTKVWSAFETYMQEAPDQHDPLVAYFSMEYGLHESLKIYSGGLGVLAGDYLKEASDYNKRLVGIGVLFRYGYFTQRITPGGDQEAQNLPQKFTELPIHPVRDENGEWIEISIALPGRNMCAKVWKVHVGRITLYLLDADLETNVPADRSVSHQLYGGDWENRLKQEILLGVGGIRLLERLKITPDVYHCNEGHAAFSNFERMRDLVQKEFLTFEEALEVVRSSALFTTHTPVPAGHDRFSEDLLRIYIGHYPERLHITWEELMAMGKVNPEEPGEMFSMSVLGIKTSHEVNGVSKLHGEVSRDMFKNLFEGYFTDELHINHVTNGVHYPTWAHPEWQKMHSRFLNFPDLDNQQDEKAWSAISEISNLELWNTRNSLRLDLLSHLRQRLTREMTKRQESPAHIVKVLESLEQPMLTIGFARRFATYKRAHLLFANMERLDQLINDEKRPLRFLFAGKAHPNDKAGQDLIKRIIEISRQPRFEGRIIFIENYDMELGRFLTQGCDVWLNTPTRPMEASGTSGEKAVMNGVLNLSVLDGWWAEGFTPNAGWALPMKKLYHEQEKQDQLDAETIYNLLEEKIKTAFYQRNQDDVPEQWIGFIKNNFQHIAPHFTMRRMLQEYHEKFYGKLGKRNQLIRADNYLNARRYAAWKRKVLVNWGKIQVIERKLHDSTIKPLNLGDLFEAEILLHAPGLSGEDIKVELIVGQKVHDEVQEIFFKEPLEVNTNGSDQLRFHCAVTMRGVGVYDFAFRCTPKHPLMEHGMEFPLVKWV